MSEHKRAIITALKNSHKNAEIFHREEVKRLTKNVEMLRKRISKIYLDKLDDLIDDEFIVIQ